MVRCHHHLLTTFYTGTGDWAGAMRAALIHRGLSPEKCARRDRIGACLTGQESTHAI
jgi:hypothetical protein